MQIQPILGYIWAILGLYQPPAPPPPFGSHPPPFLHILDPPLQTPLMTEQNLDFFTRTTSRESVKMFKKNSVIHYACQTWCNPVRSACAYYYYCVHGFHTAYAWHEFSCKQLYWFHGHAGKKNLDLVQLLVAFGISNIC